jgi:hypothetical protein
MEQGGNPMTKKEVITEAMIQAALAALEKRIAKPPPPEERRYTHREAFLRLRAKAKEALAAGHSLETVLDDLKGIGLGMTISTARQYLKPGRKLGKPRAALQTELPVRRIEKSHQTTSATEKSAKKGTFNVIEDDKEI